MPNIQLGGATAVIAVVASCSIAGCASTQAVSDGLRSGAAVGANPTAEQSPATSGIRIEAVQRVDSETGDTVTGIVTLRNVSGAQRTVSLGITWVTVRDAGSGDAAAVSRETLTLAPRECREVVFQGEPGARDFKVSLTSPGG